MTYDLITANQNSKLALAKSKKLLDITSKILVRKNDDEWVESLFDWVKINIIQERTHFPKTKEEILITTIISLRWNRLWNSGDRIPIYCGIFMKYNILAIS